jgi:hypothetical protein
MKIRDEVRYTFRFFVEKEYTVSKVISFYFRRFISGEPLRMSKKSLELVAYLIALEKELKKQGAKIPKLPSGSKDQFKVIKAQCEKETGYQEPKS